MRDAAGRLVALPLRSGCAFCLLHTVLFRTLPVDLGDCVLAFCDLETTSLDVLSGSIVEIGAVIGNSGSKFSTVVKPPRMSAADGPTVHGISQEELAQGPPFREAFKRLEHFLNFAAVSTPESDSDSDGYEPAKTMKDDLEIVLVAHNGANFDFPFLLSECLRAGLCSGVSTMARWRFVDTLDVLRATDIAGDCKKLQCSLRACRGPSCLHAHRALDDCIALEVVVEHVSARLGVGPTTLLRPFAKRLDEAASVAQIGALVSG